MMMRALTQRVALVFGVAVALGMVAGLFAAAAWKSEADDDFSQLVEGSGLRFLAHELDQTDPAAWPGLLERAQPHFGFPLRVASTAAGGIGFPPIPEVAVPIGDGGSFLVLGPMSGPALGPVLWPLFVFVATVGVAASALLSLPLAWRLRQTQDAIRQLGEGRWGHRLDTSVEGPLRSLAERVNQTAEQLSNLFREREHLLQAVSHELGTPLSRMRFQLELLEPVVPEPERARLDHLRRDLAELDELSSELVGWVEAGAPARLRSSFAVDEVLAPLLELAGQDAEHLATHLQVPSGWRLSADLRLFQRAIENLLRNAVRYARTTVVLAARHDGEFLVVEVRDDGPGIPAAHRERLLEPFTRVHGSRSRDDGGLGLGLAIVHRIVGSHGGQTVITAAPEGGTCVVTRWPGLVRVP